MRILLIIILAAYGFYSCIIHASDPGPMIAAHKKFIDPIHMIREGQSLLIEGDLVLRLNQDPNSRYIKNFNRIDKSYSHAGIVLFENGFPFIYHIVNGEENPGEKMRRDSLSHFADPRKNLAFGIYRYKLKDKEIRKIKTLIRHWNQIGIRFDPKFDLDTDNKMYCSEMIMKALAKGTNNRIMTETTALNRFESGVLSAYLQLPFSYTKKLRIVSMDNLYKNQYCEIIEKYNF